MNLARRIQVGLLLISASCCLAEEDQKVTTTYAGSFFEVQAPLGLRRSIMPGPPRNRGPKRFELTDENSSTMSGIADEEHERWLDAAGNMYSAEFMRRFSYTKPGTNGPVVRIRVDKESSTFSGRLEARGLKPNFAYQMKLRGVFKHRKSFEAIGYAGRWRLPGLGTNYADEDYRAYEKKEEVEAYLFFDYFVTDADGDAIRDFALDSCLHVLWNGTHQRLVDSEEDLYLAIVWANNRAVYARPKTQGTIERIWAEVEFPRYKRADQKRFLPPGEYQAEFVLTEESFHSWDRDGGYWATVSKVPVEFTITEKKENEGKD